MYPLMPVALAQFLTAFLFHSPTCKGSDDKWYCYLYVYVHV